MVINQYKASQYNLSMEKVRKLLDNTNSLREKVLIGGLYYGGLRRFEIAKLKIEDINFQEETITVLGKHNKISPIPTGSIFPEYFTDLKHYIKSLNKHTGYLFQSQMKQFTKDGVVRKFDDKHIDISRVNQILEEVAKRANIVHPNPATKMNRNHIMVVRKVNPHLLRHSLARHLKSLRFPLEFIQNYMRHSSIKTTMDVYGTLGPEEMKEIAHNMTGTSTNPKLIE